MAYKWFYATFVRLVALMGGIALLTAGILEKVWNALH